MLEGGHHAVKCLNVAQLQVLVFLVDVAILDQLGIKRRRAADCPEVCDGRHLFASPACSTRRDVPLCPARAFVAVGVFNPKVPELLV